MRGGYTGFLDPINTHCLILSPLDHTLRMKTIRFYSRVFWGDMPYSALNLVGLVLGLSVFLLLCIFIHSEMSYDAFHEKKEQLFRVTTTTIDQTGEMDMGITAHELAPLLKAEFPVIKAYVRFLKVGEVNVKIDAAGMHNSFFEKNVYRADSNTFSLFDHQFILGSPAGSLKNRNNVVLTRLLAEKYFGTVQNAYGKMLTISEDAEENCIVTGIIENLPNNAHLKFDALVAGIPDRGFVNQDGTINPSRLFAIDYLYTYLLLPANYHPARFAGNWKTFYKKYYERESKVAQTTMSHELTPLAKVHFEAKKYYDLPAGNQVYLYSFFALAAVILVITSVNYINVVSAQATKKAKGITFRKVLGASKRSLILLLINEYILLSLVAYAISMLLVWMAISNNSFMNMIGISIETGFFYTIDFFLLSLTSVLVISLLTGLYPSVYVLKYSDLHSLKSFQHSFNAVVRKFLITFQLSCSLVVILLTCFILMQNEFVKNKDLGFDAKNVLVVRLKNKSQQEKALVFKNKLLQDKDVISVSTSNFAPTSELNMDGFRRLTGTNQEWISIAHIRVGLDYFKTLNIGFAAGNIPENSPEKAYAGQVVLNEAAVKALGLTNPLHEPLEFIGRQHQPTNVAGVVRDFNFRSLHYRTEPLVISIDDSRHKYVLIKMREQTSSQFLARLQGDWKSVFINDPLEYSQYKEDLNQLYRSDFSRGSLLLVISILGILIAVLGLVGLSAYTIKLKEKQIAVRRVLGANAFEIIKIFAKETFVIALIAAVIAFPLAGYFFSRWIQNYAYRIDYPVVQAGLVVLFFMALLLGTVAFLSGRAANKKIPNALKG